MRTLTTERFTLAPWDQRFVEDFHRLGSDPRVTRHLGDGRPWDRERVINRHLEHLEHWAEHGFGWRAILDADERVLGVAALNRLARPLPGIKEPAIEIGWWVAPEDWGRGVATEAATAIRDEAFTDHGAARLAARYQPANHASGRVMVKLGMTRHGDDILGPYGEPVRVYVLERDDWCQGR